MSETPTCDFTVLGLAYPNDIEFGATPLSGGDIALRLSHDMDIEWFLKSADLKHYACTGIVRGGDDTEIAFGFDFGPYDRAAGHFTECHTIIVRETAGGGFMLLSQDAALAFSHTTHTLFDAIIADRDRENPEDDDDDDDDEASGTP